MADIDDDDDDLDDDSQCEHVICTCKKSEDSAYCSVYCETAGDTVELACDCGHSSCATESHH